MSHDRSGAHPSWFLTDISMQDKHTGEDFVVCSPPSNFASGGLRRFFATDRDDGETCREFAVAVSGHTPPYFRMCPLRYCRKFLMGLNVKLQYIRMRICRYS